jgi:hypothetical protein
MFRKLLIGPVLLAGGCITGSHYGASAEQLVHKEPAAVYAAVEQAVSARDSGVVQLENGRTISYGLRVHDAMPGERMALQLAMDGKPAGTADIVFTPQNGSKDTLMSVKLHAQGSVIREELAGTSKAKLGYAPDWLLNLTFRPVLQKLAEQMESGAQIGDAMRGFQSQADWQSSLPPDKQRQIQEWRQYDASRPITDPNADAQRYLNSN